MSHDPVLMMLGLARRAGKLALGDEMVREACGDKKARCVLVAADAGTSTAKKAAFYAERANVPLVTLPHDKDSLGAAIGKNGCALCAVTDIGMAAAAVRHLAAQDARYAVASAQLDEKNERIQSRRSKKKPKDRQKENRSAEKPQQRQRTDDKPRRFTGERRKPNENPHARRAFNRKFPRRMTER